MWATLDGFKKSRTPLIRINTVCKAIDRLIHSLIYLSRNNTFTVCTACTASVVRHLNNTIIVLVLYTHVIRRLTNGITMMYITHDCRWLGQQWLHKSNYLFLLLKLVAYTIHFPLDFRFLPHFIVAMFIGLMACIIYCLFYHLATMHICIRVGIY